jgi:hypothetical protein
MRNVHLPCCGRSVILARKLRWLGQTRKLTGERLQEANKHRIGKRGSRNVNRYRTWCDASWPTAGHRIVVHGRDPTCHHLDARACHRSTPSKHHRQPGNLAAALIHVFEAWGTHVSAQERARDSDWGEAPRAPTNLITSTARGSQPSSIFSHYKHNADRDSKVVCT